MADEFGVLYVSSYNLPVWRIIERSNVEYRVYEYERREARELVGWDSEPVPHWKDTPSGVDVLIVRGRTWPFVVSVERQWYEANLSAGGETSCYLALFGLPLHICTFECWVS